ncbi:MAG: 30S ribosomal protein S20 [Blastocatellia bacterium]|nr:30S ribosomal protein S20 [Blastocatellia bacterium]
MPNHVSAEKRDRQNARRNVINRRNRSTVRTAVKKMRSILEDGNKEQAQALLSATVSRLDKAVQKGVMHRNTAARHKARLTMHTNELLAK